MILLIDNYDSFTHNLSQAFSMQNEKVHVVRNDQISIEQIEKMDLKGIVISPGPGRPEDAGICIEVIQKLGKKLPILGVCLGHQAIGIAFGGEVVNAKEILHGKDSLIFHFRGSLFKGVSLPFKAGRYHSLIVEHNDLPSELKVEAEDVAGNVMALSHQTLPIFSFQFHPESIMTTEGQKLIKNFIDFCGNFLNKKVNLC
ncbi:MAG: aminodeoxychorismate/anthranilate synthase component II [Parachlamydiaceae bacterium]|nr:aminodeoxychorismate/anthranilate synthase component II [Parachlamydiaceae bacterium]